MTHSTPNRRFPNHREFNLKVRKFFLRCKIDADLVLSRDCSHTFIESSATDNWAAHKAACIIEKSHNKAHAWIAAYCADPTMRSCRIGEFTDPMNEELDELAGHYFVKSGKLDEWRLKFQ